MTTQEKFFRASSMAGRLHLSDIGDYGFWDADCIRYGTEEYIRAAFVKETGDRFVRTAQELDAALEATRGVPGVRTIWIREDLLEEARRRWEEMKRSLP